MCDLLRAFPGWEAIKTTRGHYRSCGKDPHSCCVSDLLRDEPVIFSGREQTYELGKDTGRYWDAGAANVHWVITTNQQTKAGIEKALQLVRADGVFVEGNSFAEYVIPDFFIMVARPDDSRLKGSARTALERTSAIFISAENGFNIKELFESSSVHKIASDVTALLPVFTRANLHELVLELQKMTNSSGCEKV
jgi:hypothetical protein